MKQWGQWLETALFPNVTDQWLTFLRLGLGLEVVLNVLALKNDWNYLFASSQDLTTAKVSEALLSLTGPFAPRLRWLIEIGAYLGLTEQAVISTVWWGLLVAGFGLLIGSWSRTCALLAWFLHLSVVKSGGLVSYGVDQFMTIGLFYLMLSPLPDRWSFDYWLRNKRPTHPELLGFWRRGLQVHLCIIYFFGGLTKCLGNGWWDGSNLWRALIRPPFNLIPPEILVRWHNFFPLAGILICLIEIAYPAFIWPRSTRALWLTAIIGMHVAIGLAMGMYLFALVMVVLNIAAFGPDMVWRRQPIQLEQEQVVASA